MQGSILSSTTFGRGVAINNNAQRQEFAQALSKAKETTTIGANDKISRELPSLTKSNEALATPSSKSFSYQVSSEMVSQRFEQRDFSVFVPPSALSAYKSE